MTGKRRVLEPARHRCVNDPQVHLPEAFTDGDRPGRHARTHLDHQAAGLHRRCDAAVIEQDLLDDRAVDPAPHGRIDRQEVIAHQRLAVGQEAGQRRLGDLEMGGFGYPGRPGFSSTSLCRGRSSRGLAPDCLAQAVIP